jgi:hypothetical protein
MKNAWFRRGHSDANFLLGVAMIVVFLLILTFALMFGLPMYFKWQAGMAGQAEYLRAEQNRKIKVLEAQAFLESAKSLGDAEVERARGVAAANKIIGESLKDNEAYLRYLWVSSLNGGRDQVIYIPTEAGLPILESQRLSKTVQK